MRLISLGGLRLEGQKFRREKPLLLLAFVSLEGPKPRRYLAELFWPDKKRPLSNLAVALNHLRKFNAAESNDSHVWAEIKCDAVEFREHLSANHVQVAAKLYQGAFAESASLQDLGPELEEWVLLTRECLGDELRGALLRQGEDAARNSRFAEAGELAEKAYKLSGTAPLAPEELPRYYRLLRAADHPLRRVLEEESQELEIKLDAPVEVVRQHLKPHFVGRQGELERLSRLEAGQWAWLHGGPGIGKTALLRELAQQNAWTYLPARSGLPYATLEPVLGDITNNETILLRRLNQLETGLLLDDWSNIDFESQALLSKLHHLRPQFPVVVAGEKNAPFAIDLNCELGVLTAGELIDYPDVFQATGGVPALVGAYLSGEPLENALSNRLTQLNNQQRQVYAALALMPVPDLSLVRQALGIEGAELVQIFEHLMNVGLVEASCEVRGPSVALDYLKGEPLLAQQLSLKLARLLSIEQAMPLYQRAKPIWEDSDLQRVEQAFKSWAEELLKRGFPQKAIEALKDCPHSQELLLLKARALERSNMFKPALDVLDDLPSHQRTLALRSRVLFKLGYPDQAKACAEESLNDLGDLEAQAEALNTLGEIALRSGQPQEAIDIFGRCSTLWQAAGQKSRWLLALNNRAVANCALGESTEEAFAEVLEAAKEDQTVQATIWTNMGVTYTQQQSIKQAEAAYHKAIQLGSEVGALNAVILAWNGLGFIYHNEQLEKARHAYQSGLEVCKETRNAQLTATLLANLAELDHDIPSLEQAIELLERGGFAVHAENFRQRLKTFIER